MCKKILETLNKALDIHGKIKQKENDIKMLKESLALYSFKLEKEMKEKDKTELLDETGSAKLVIQNRKGTIDETMVSKKLKVDNLDEFRKESKEVKFIKYNIIK